ncbi:MAG: hypothetical protein EBE86_029440 [Hormoscilla sp. GUM202]|nr:hypothetical protein [Hormoscilla sp. GUM202]
MNTKELLQQVKYILDDRGNQTAVQMDLELWQKLQPLLKSLSAHEEIQQRRKNLDEIIPWEEFQLELAAMNFPTIYNCPEDFISAIKESFARGGLHIARRLAYRGVELYPDREILNKYARILAPPVVKVSPSSPERRQNFLANHEWLKENRFKYRGRWIALRNGKLLGNAADVDELVAQVGDLKGIFFTRVV